MRITPQYSYEKNLQHNSMEKYSFSRVSHIHKYLALSPLQPYLPSKLLLEPHDWENFTNFLVVPQETHLPIILLLPLWSRPAPQIRRPYWPQADPPGVQVGNLTNFLHPWVTCCSPTLDSGVLPPPRVSYPPPQPHTSRFRPGKERGLWKPGP